LLTKPRKRVYFSRSPVPEIASEATREEVANSWLTKAETSQIALEAKRDAQSFRQRSPESCDAFLALFQECSKKLISKKNLCVAKCAQTILHFETPIRGLERRMHSEMRTYRVFHVQSLLKIQEKCSFMSTTNKKSQPEILRYRSLQTSQGSRALARLLGHGDAIQVANAVREELFGK
jgi:hypothetical protein